jgi:hypothetical protein
MVSSVSLSVINSKVVIARLVRDCALGQYAGTVMIEF